MKVVRDLFIVLVVSVLCFIVYVGIEFGNDTLTLIATVILTVLVIVVLSNRSGRIVTPRIKRKGLKSHHVGSSMGAPINPLCAAARKVRIVENRYQTGWDNCERIVVYSDDKANQAKLLGAVIEDIRIITNLYDPSYDSADLVRIIEDTGYGPSRSEYHAATKVRVLDC